MKEMNNKEKFSEKEWEELASILSGEKGENNELLKRFESEDIHKTGDKWRELVLMSSEKEIDVDKAWNKVSLKMNENRFRIMRYSFIRVAAVALIILGIGSVAFYLNNSGYLSKKISASTNIGEKNIVVGLPDGSKISLNRNSEITYRENFGKRNRNVKLSGEAFFEIAPDASKPFIIDAGEANVKVVGTSFNVITNNTESAVEVFVKTGKVILSDKSGSQSIALEPGFVGKMDSKISGKTLNEDPNYLSWNTGLLVYDGQKLDVVFNDLKRVYNMNIVVDDPSILENPWNSPIDNATEDTIIQLICASFNLSYTKDGDVYHLAKK
jgi:ferric-dicitrate binding protein FerR (iron transport regulator)